MLKFDFFFDNIEKITIMIRDQVIVHGKALPGLKIAPKSVVSFYVCGTLRVVQIAPKIEVKKSRCNAGHVCYLPTVTSEI